ncbi:MULTISPECIES: Zn-dependent hydrolase [Salinibaculum]|uniref:Zn-dependent hydrolase n=1 Tax=Salinibaculum TaxID=2732368 RepID=UPI0030D59A77
MTSQFSIDGDTLQTDIRQNATFGDIDADVGRGRTVLPGDQANGGARDYLINQMEDAGLEVRVDAVGNIAGRWTPPGTTPDVAPVAAGSHLDSVPRGGIFDGALGVYAALEAVRAIQRSRVELRRPLEVVCFTGEEGTRFADGVLGSSVATGHLSVDEALSLSDGTVTLREALRTIGYQGAGRLDAGEWAAWLELHIEQGGSLEAADVPIGIVTDVTGTVRGEVHIQGEADHAGTTGMAERSDALVAASELVRSVEETASDLSATGTGTAVGTVGELNVGPNVVNVVPGSVSLSLDIRSICAAEIDTQLDAVEGSVAAIETDYGVDAELEITYDVSPTALSPAVQDVLQTAADNCSAETMSVHSGGGHDTMQVADVTEAGLVFVPSEGGHSHSPKESVAWDDCIVATEVLAEALAELARTGAHQQC